jgi:hypothetical protein
LSSTALVLCAAASAYGLLVGAGTWLLQPDRGLRAMVTLLVTAAIIALWVRIARHAADHGIRR